MLTLLVVVNSTNFACRLHLCMGEMESVSLSGEAGSCEIHRKTQACAGGEHGAAIVDHQHVQDNGCCECRILTVTGKNEPTKLATNSVPDFPQSSDLHTAGSFLYKVAIVDVASYNEYSPPLIERDIPLLVQSFLI